MYDKLISLIKEKNPAITIYLCSCCPRGDTDVDNMNRVIKELSEIHIVELWHVISNDVAFWQVYTQTNLCSLFLSIETPNDVQSVA